jgi:hypothetical protein
MTERKPAGMSFETWIERQIRDAQDRGEFDGLKTHGKPLEGLDGPADDLWWVKSWLRREDLSYLPPALQLRKDVEDCFTNLADAPTEEAVRTRVAELNERIVKANSTYVPGPPSSLMPLTVERVVQRWRDERAARDRASA